MTSPLHHYLDQLSNDDCRKMLRIAVDRLIECEEWNYREHDADRKYGCNERVYWCGSGDDVLEDD